MRAGDPKRRRGGVGGAGAAVMSTHAKRAGDCAPCPAPPRRAASPGAVPPTSKNKQNKQLHSIAISSKAEPRAPCARATRLLQKNGGRLAPRTIERRTATRRATRSHPGASPPISRIPLRGSGDRGRGAEGAGAEPPENSPGAHPSATASFAPGRIRPRPPASDRGALCVAFARALTAAMHQRPPPP